MVQVRVAPAIKVIEENRDVIVGVKIRLTGSIAFYFGALTCLANIAGDGANEEEAYSRALEVARKVNLPLMTHHALSSVPLGGAGLTCPGSLSPGDIYTHTYHGWASTIMNPSSKKEVHEACMAARERGIIFDVGHGAGAFNWTVAETACVECGFYPDVISTDMHTVAGIWPCTCLLRHRQHMKDLRMIYQLSCPNFYTSRWELRILFDQ